MCAGLSPGAYLAGLQGFSLNEPIEFEDRGPRKRIVLAGLQDWCDKFEAYVRANPANWLFWMDKRWTRVIRSGAAVTGT